jgi:hypothetical protein
MAQVIKEIKVEVSKPNFFEAIVAKQFDNKSRWLRVQLVDNGENITVEDTSTVTINAKRADGGEKSFEGSVDKGKGTVLVPLAYWMLQLEGKVVSDVSVTDTSGRILTSTSFTIQVERASCQDNNVADDDVNVITLRSLIEEVQQVKDSYEVEQTYDSTNTKALSGVAVAQALESFKEYVDESLENVQGGGEQGGSTTDQTYNPQSTNAQSGIAVAQAIQILKNYVDQRFEDIGQGGGGELPDDGGTTPDDGGGTDSETFHFSNYEPQVGYMNSSGEFTNINNTQYVNTILIPVQQGDEIGIDRSSGLAQPIICTFDENGDFMEERNGAYIQSIYYNEKYVRIALSTKAGADLTEKTDADLKRYASYVILTRAE